MMKTKFLITAIGAALLMGSLQAEAVHTRSASAPPATNWKQIAIPPLPPFTPKEPTRVVLPNGMTLFLTENHELPLISGSAVIRGGSNSEPADKTGLVELYGETWRTGGSEKLTGDQLDDSLEARAAKVETSGGDDSTGISFDCLKADFPEVFATFLDLLRHPAFREDKLSLAKKEMYSEISRRNDETGSIASIQTDILGYGKQSAYARIPEYATVGAVTREDLLEWHRQHTSPNNIIFGIVGDFDTQEMEAMLRKAFADWPSGEKVAEPKVAIDPAKPGIYLVDKSDVNQSEIRMIGMGIKRSNPDYFALQVMNQIFGGGFSSRLFMNLRTKAGLAYAVGGGVGSGWDHSGLTILEIGTKTETTVEAIKGLWEQIDLMKKDPPTEAETRVAKDAILNSFIFNLDTPAKVLHEKETYEFYGYPSDFLERYRAAVEKVTPADVYRVANQYLHRNELKILVVGNASEFQKQLAALGPVSPIDITIPSPEAKISEARSSKASVAATGERHREAPLPQAMAENAQDSVPQQAGANAEGRAAIATLIENVGGAAKLASIKTLHQHLRTTQEGVETRIDQSTVYPDRQVLTITYQIGATRQILRQVLTPDAAFLLMPPTKQQELPPSQRAVMEAALKCDFLNVLQHASDPKYTFTASGKEKLGNTEATVVDINADGASTRWWIGPDGTLLQDARSAAGSRGPETFITKYSRWTNSGGLKYPMRQEIFSNGAEQSMTIVDELEVNQPVDPKLFEKP